MTRFPARRLRCAIYTRVSTEAGLEQEFNSLDAQREAAEAYVRSQAHENWTSLRTRYDDGGFSGGSLERPALQQLLDDIRGRRLDVVVVYKVDRLTRSLADFAKLVELFDAHEVSFVSVTQAFNTTSSMGRLTLNVLLSFAQFEREVTGERIRDKIAASKRKGLWMGGPAPLGYRVQARKLVVDEAEASAVRLIFERYLALGSLTQLLRELRQRGIVTKQRPLASGVVRGGIAFTRGPAAYLLKNRTYLGEIVHRGGSHPGEHQAIISRELFDAVQNKLTSRSQGSGEHKTRSQALLTGKLFDDRGNRMTPSHASKAGRRYRYYVCCALDQGRAEQAGSVTRVSAPGIEAAILQALRERSAEEPDDHALVARHLERAILHRDTIEMILRPDAGGEAVSGSNHPRAPDTHEGDPEEVGIDHTGPLPEVIRIVWSQPSPTRRREIIRPGSLDDPRPIRAEQRATLVRAIALGRSWLAELVAGTVTGPDQIAARESCSKRHVTMMISLAFLSPELVKAAVGGRLSRGIGLRNLSDPSMAWSRQHRSLGL
ncbi:recombinase family protein [Methylobacterium frigidaeris]|uniref:Recombinase family protein n=1 Tax=Methylobacterium frigidaeris TaxID=2038277 RepID=A0AA37HIV0_9HYPH|nr:recombinase family protein [Methylobacterium frigidaeris]GJD66815.1 hypothetical protein MPEAHAMD_7014 [Methylobacterium frigidaeris]